MPCMWVVWRTVGTLCKVKQNLPFNQPRRPRRGVEVYLYSFFNCSAVWWVDGQHHTTAALPQGNYPVPIVLETGWVRGSVWTGAENLAVIDIRSPDHPARSELLYWLRYPSPHVLLYRSKQCHVPENCSCVQTLEILKCRRPVGSEGQSGQAR